MMVPTAPHGSTTRITANRMLPTLCAFNPAHFPSSQCFWAGRDELRLLAASSTRHNGTGDNGALAANSRKVATDHGCFGEHDSRRERAPYDMTAGGGVRSRRSGHEGSVGRCMCGEVGRLRGAIGGSVLASPWALLPSLGQAPAWFVR